MKALLVLDSEGVRICAKYYQAPEWPTLDKQLAFEKILFAKTRTAKVDGTCVPAGLVDSTGRRVIDACAWFSGSGAV